VSLFDSGLDEIDFNSAKAFWCRNAITNRVVTDYHLMDEVTHSV
jgi:hypothetical protein